MFWIKFYWLLCLKSLQKKHYQAFIYIDNYEHIIGQYKTRNEAKIALEHVMFKPYSKNIRKYYTF